VVLLYITGYGEEHTLNARERQEELERSNLSPYAAKSADTRGREVEIEPCAIRTAFQRDRDRVIHSKAFRRLKYKTQVFLMPDGDHYRTRLTHTLEVSQIARTIARALRLNEDLTEAIALAHDVGHTPFGHVGESVLNELLPGGFEHNVQSRRVMEFLENDGKGKNLTLEVRDGIEHHKRDGTPMTLEGKVVSYADRIAYLNHDIEDAIRAGVLKQSDIPAKCIEAFGDTHGARINAMIQDIIENCENQPDICMSRACEAAMNTLRGFMFERVYLDKVAKAEEGKAQQVVKALFGYYCAHPEMLSDEYAEALARDGVGTAAADYISGMTDRYAIHVFQEIYVPRSWSY